MSADALPPAVRVALLRMVDGSMHQRLHKVLKALMYKGKAREFFNSPVTGNADFMANYTLAIKQPMDLGRVKENLEGDKSKGWKDKTYVYAEEFAHDVRLVPQLWQVKLAV